MDPMQSNCTKKSHVDSVYVTCVCGECCFVGSRIFNKQKCLRGFFRNIINLAGRPLYNVTCVEDRSRKAAEAGTRSALFFV